MANRLAAETSPYLLQHAHNPVDWFPWGEEAFARARQLDRPLFLSIGYSTCHWCHVMEHESFADRAIADLINAEFVPVKVDREERPDVDRVYMTFVQATTGSGGWPMSVWLTPDLEPFYGSTYFPPTSRHGRPGFPEVLRELARLWREERERILEAAKTSVSRLRSATGHFEEGDLIQPSAVTVVGTDALDRGVGAFAQAFDRRFGGFGDAPKFPRPSDMLFLLREHARTGAPEPRTIAIETLRAMALGGMRDHIGGGFHRYSVDARWRVPHFEKMLYDQAQLVLAYLEGAQASQEAFYATVAADTLAYVRRDLTHPDGGFYSAEDADSVPPEMAGSPDAHKSEGAFYIWSEQEIDALLEPADARIVRLRFGVEPNGNAPFDPQGEFTGKNLLFTATTIEEIATRTGTPPDDLVDVLARARQRLFDARATRPRPHLDDKVLTAWNGLMIAAAARASRVLHGFGDAAGAEAARLMATRAAAFVRERLWRVDDRTLLRRWRAGQAGIDAYGEDYACLIWGLLELLQATGDADWLAWALELQDRQDALFWDEVEGGYFSTTGQDKSVLVRLKEDQDGAEPAATSIAVQNLLVLSHLVGEDGRSARIERTLARAGPLMTQAARAIPFMMANLSTWHAGLSQIVIVGREDSADTAALQHVVDRHYLSFAVTLRIDPPAPGNALATQLPWIVPMTLRDGAATAYVCRNFTCAEPVTSPEALERLLARGPDAA